MIRNVGFWFLFIGLSVIFFTYGEWPTMDIQMHDTYYVIGIDQLIMFYGSVMALSGVGYLIRGVFEGKYVWLRYVHLLLNVVSILTVISYLVNFELINADDIARTSYNWILGFVHLLLVFGVLLYIINVFLALFNRQVKPN